MNTVNLNGRLKEFPLLINAEHNCSHVLQEDVALLRNMRSNSFQKALVLGNSFELVSCNI